MGLTPDCNPQESDLEGSREYSMPKSQNSHISSVGDDSARLVDILSQISGLDPCQIKPSSRLIEDVGIDSLGFYEILIEAKEYLGIKIREEDLQSFQTVQDIEDYLNALKSPDDQDS